MWKLYIYTTTITKLLQIEFIGVKNLLSTSLGSWKFQVWNFSGIWRDLAWMNNKSSSYPGGDSILQTPQSKKTLTSQDKDQLWVCLYVVPFTVPTFSLFSMITFTQILCHGQEVTRSQLLIPGWLNSVFHLDRMSFNSNLLFLLLQGWH